MNLSGLIRKVSDFAASLPGKPNVSFVAAQRAREASACFGNRTAAGSLNFTSSQKALSTAQTVYIDSREDETSFTTQKKKEIEASLERTLDGLFAYLDKCPIRYTDGRLGGGSAFSAGCRLYVSCYRPCSIRLNYMFSLMTFPGASAPELTAICIPEWPERDRQVLVFKEIGVTFILGSDYYGEIKNAFLRMAIASCGDPGLHAASKLMTVENAEGRLQKTGVVLFGISSTGKTTHACHDHGFRKPGESARILQDDLVFWREDGTLAGTERGFYIRTDKLGPASQPLLWRAANSPLAVLENVVVDYEGRPRFDDKTLTSNGRGVIPREALPGSGTGGVDLPPPDRLDRTIFIFMTKNFTVIPILSRLSCEQAAVAYMLTEPFDAVGSEIGKLDGKGGVSAVTVGIGRSRDSINTFYRRLKAYPSIECYMLNNGGVGELVDTGLDGGRRVRKKVTRISIPEVSALIRSLLRNTVRWTDDKNWMCQVPSFAEGVDLSLYDLYAHYDQSRIDMLISQVRSERRAVAARYEGLDERIVDSIDN